jgi:magnesium-transporting ATPase (P-type)
MENKLKMMRFWLFGTFVILFAAITVYFGYIQGISVFTNLYYWIFIVVALVLCVAGFYIYKGYLGRKE